MIGEIVHTPTGSYVRCAPDDGLVSRDADVLGLLGSCYEIGANRLLLDEQHLHPDFFDLKTGLAGAIFLKLTNYRAKTAVLATLVNIQNERFQELIFECNKGQQINFFDDLTKAEQWLTG
ncbi:MAG: DUF4180 domain-containing protein [Anaerolineae bacterium]